MKTWISLCLLLMSSTAGAVQAVQSLEAINTAVRDHVKATIDAGDDVEIVIGRLDPRLRLPLCEQPLDTRFAHGRRAAGPQSIEVRCPGNKPWSLYVSVEITRFANVVVAARPIARASLIREIDLLRERRKLPATNVGYATDAARITGHIAARFIPTGQALRLDHVERPRLVKRGERVILASGDKSIEVRVSGTALEDGAAGEQVSVRNSSSDRVIEGTVSGNGVVIVQTGLGL